MATMPKITSICKEALGHLKNDWGAAVLCTLAFIWIPCLPILLDGLTHDIFKLDFWCPIPPSDVISVELLIIFFATTILLVLPLGFGYQCTFLKYVRKDTASPSGNMLSVFEHRYGRWLLASLLFFSIVFIGPEIVLWGLSNLLMIIEMKYETALIVLIVLSVIILISSLILYYHFAVLPYIVNDNPELSIWKCFKRSSSLLKGFRWRLFFIDLIFVGPMLLLSIVLSILLPYNIYTLCTFALSIIYLWITPWALTVRALFYSHIVKS